MPDEAELAELNRLTTMFLDFAEDRAQRRQQTLMADWVAQADRGRSRLVLRRGARRHAAVRRARCASWGTGASAVRCR